MTMSEVRRRKLPTKSDSKPAKSKSSQSTKGVLKLCYLSVVIFTLLIIGVYLNIIPSWKVIHSANFLDSISVHLGLQRQVHAVIIDAGSTGSRVVAFSFYESKRDKSLKLTNELFVELKPGLSAFAGNPKESTKNLQELLKRAKAVIPKDDWKRTPLAMKATAGLRLLPGDKADAILDEARKLFAMSGFLVSENSVGIMDGADEGIFSWFTVNFLLDRLGGEIKDTVAALDLGGGSTQITFALTDNKAIREIDSKFLHQITAFHQNLNVYTHSYLNKGLQAARKAILQVGNSDGSFILKSECVNPLVQSTKWSYGGIEYIIKGPENAEYVTQKVDGEVFKSPVVNYNKCESIVKNHVGQLDKPAELKHKEITAFSYYFERAVESGMVDVEGGTVTVQKFIDQAKIVCADANVDLPLLCLDLTYIGVLLRDGFGLEPTKSIRLIKKIDGHEVSWALGAAFHVIQNGL